MYVSENCFCNTIDIITKSLASNYMQETRLANMKWENLREKMKVVIGGHTHTHTHTHTDTHTHTTAQWRAVVCVCVSVCVCVCVCVCVVCVCVCVCVAL